MVDPNGPATSFFSNSQTWEFLLMKNIESAHILSSVLDPSNKEPSKTSLVWYDLILRSWIFAFIFPECLSSRTQFYTETHTQYPGLNIRYKVYIKKFQELGHRTSAPELVFSYPRPPVDTIIYIYHKFPSFCSFTSFSICYKHLHLASHNFSFLRVPHQFFLLNMPTFFFLDSTSLESIWACWGDGSFIVLFVKSPEVLFLQRENFA